MNIPVKISSEVPSEISAYKNMTDIVIGNSTAALFRNQFLKSDDQLICLNDDLSIGHLSQNRKAALNDIGIDTDPDFEKAYADFFEQIMNLNKDDNPVIWTSQSPCDMAGFYAACSMINPEISEIKAVFLKDPAAVMISSREEYEELRKNAVWISVSEYAQKYKKLKEENSILRANKNGELTSVNEEHYDDLIRKYADDKESGISRAVLTYLNENGQLLNAEFLAYRLKKLNV